MAAGLIPARSVREKLLALPSIEPLLQAAETTGSKGMLDEAMLDSLLTQIQTPVVARTIAPIAEPEPMAAPRIHDLDHYKLADFPMHAKDVDAEITIHFDITGKSVTEGKKEDIQSCFNDRLKQIRRLILDRNLPNRPIAVNEAVRQRKQLSDRDNAFTIIGLVNDPKTTKNGHLMFSIEDHTGEIRCLLSQRDEDSPNQQIVHAGLMADDVIGVSGHFNQDGTMMWVEDIHFPALTTHERRTAGEDQAVSAAFISDLHLGSKTFLEPQWHKMIQWFHDDPLAKTIRYLVISGDGVDGVGIYP
ncbi:MAG: hypothetical protein QF684_06640, partial [Candidatus Thalassarchaeaceae archaeon]|nr:hypothetical protein [Candidatus Thalassarchaeaceae archaeon]